MGAYNSSLETWDCWSRKARLGPGASARARTCKSARRKRHKRGQQPTEGKHSTHDAENLLSLFSGLIAAARARCGALSTCYDAPAKERAAQSGGNGKKVFAGKTTSFAL